MGIGANHRCVAGTGRGKRDATVGAVGGELEHGGRLGAQLSVLGVANL